MFHVKHPVRAYRSWRRTRHVRRWRKVIEDQRAFRRTFGLPPGSKAVTYRIDAMADQLRKSLTTVTNEPR